MRRRRCRWAGQGSWGRGERCRPRTRAHASAHRLKDRRTKAVLPKNGAKALLDRLEQRQQQQEEDPGLRELGVTEQQ
eukprot:COSAG06_NODE_36301_length_449_cov_0.551429_1_plen_76_part_10